MADRETITPDEAFNLILQLTGLDRINPQAPARPLTQSSIKGRWIWGRQATQEKPSAIHVQVHPTDDQVTSLAMQSITSDDMILGREARSSLFRRRRVAIATRLNKESVEREGLILLLKRDGSPTRAFCGIIRAHRLNESA
jgi:hypothetical protein